MVHNVLVNYTFYSLLQHFYMYTGILSCWKRKRSALFKLNSFTVVLGKSNVRCEYVKIQWQLINCTTILPSKLLLQSPDSYEVKFCYVTRSASIVYICLQFSATITRGEVLENVHTSFIFHCEFIIILYGGESVLSNTG